MTFFLLIIGAFIALIGIGWAIGNATIRKSVLRGLIVAIMGCVVLGGGIYMLNLPQTSEISPTTPPSYTTPTQTNYRLQLLSTNTERAYSYITLHGQVKNICNISMENVEAIVTYFTSEGTFIKSDSALIDYNPILPYQTSPFQVITTDNPAIKTYRVEFKFLFGGSIPTDK